MAQAIVAIIGGIVILVIMFRFVRLLWRKPPDDPGSSSSIGGLPNGGV
jgi:hypothetical protein